MQAAQFIATKGTQVAISGAFGPNAYDTLSAANIQMYLAPSRREHTAAEILVLFKAGKLSKAEAATHEGHH